MPKSKFYKIAAVIVIALVATAGTYYYLRPQSSLDYVEHIHKYSALLRDEPKNCFYLGQLANGYQSLNEFDKSIGYFRQAFELCPDDFLNLFQMGVSHYMIMEREAAIKYMDQAIEGVKRQSDKKLEEMFVNSKRAWLEKWESVKSMEWNKGKVNKMKTP